MKSIRTLHSLFGGHFHLFLAKHNNKALITSQPLLRFFFFPQISVQHTTYPGDIPAISSSSLRTIVHMSRWLVPTGPLWLPRSAGCCSDFHLCNYSKPGVNYCDTTPMIQLGLKCLLKRKLCSSKRLGGWWETRIFGVLSDPRAGFSRIRPAN